MSTFVHKLGRTLRAFGLSEQGVATVEFVVVFPFFVGVFLGAFEVAVMNIRAVMLERATDIAVREIRLAGGTAVDHDDVRDLICGNSVMIADCEFVTKIELTRVDRDTWTANLGDQTDCRDRLEEEIKPPRNFVNGEENDFMLIRVCAVVDAVFPNFGVGRTIPKDDEGGYILIANSVFVNEPS